jgi:hypothetical protein
MRFARRREIPVSAAPSAVTRSAHAVAKSVRRHL